MKSCKYCREWDDKEISEDFMSGEIPLMPDVTNIALQVSCFINSMQKLEVYMDTGDAPYVKFESKKLKYCPMCGRKF